jgi:hypothetical protein
MSSKQRFDNFVANYYTWNSEAGYSVRSIQGDPMSIENKYLREMEKGQILPADIVSYAVLVNELLPLTRSGFDEEAGESKEERVAAPHRGFAAGRQQWNARSELDWRIDANDSKVDRFRKNVQKMCTNDFENIPSFTQGRLYAISNLDDFRIQDLRPFALYLGYLFKDMIEEEDAEIEMEEAVEEVVEEKQEVVEEKEEKEEVITETKGDDVDDWMADF